MGYFLIVIGVVVLVANLVTYSSRPRPSNDSINGMRRRKPGESDAAWEAGLKLYLPFGILTGVIGVLGGAAILLLGESWAVPVGGASVVLMIASAITGASLAGRRVTELARREAGLE